MTSAEPHKPLSSGFQLCEDLVPKQKCFKLRRYNQGVFEPLFHEHVPAHRISFDAAKEVLRALVVRFENLAASQILSCHLNDRGRKPIRDGHLRIVVEYLSRTCSP